MEMSFPRDKNSPDSPHCQRQRRVNPENEENSENLAYLLQIEPMYIVELLTNISTPLSKCEDLLEMQKEIVFVLHTIFGG